MLQMIKTALRITTTAFDAELYELEAAAVEDLSIAGVLPGAELAVGAECSTPAATVVVDADVYKSAVAAIGINVFVYDGTNWKLGGVTVDPAEYGIEVTGAVNGTAVTVTQDYVFTPIVSRAVITYCKLHFGEPADPERLQRSYDEQKAQLGTATGYTDWGGIIG